MGFYVEYFRLEKISLAGSKFFVLWLSRFVLGFGTNSIDIWMNKGIMFLF